MSNAELLRKIIEITVFDPDSEGNFFVFPEVKDSPVENKEQINTFNIPRELIPKKCSAFKFGYNEEFLERLKEFFIKQKPKNVFIFPPIRSYRYLSRKFKEQYKRLDLHEIILKTAIEESSERTEMGLFIPSMTLAALSKIELRNYIKEHITIRYIISCDQLFREFSTGFLLPLSLLVFQKGKESKGPIRFFRIPHSENDLMKQDELLIDFDKLAEQGGGETEYGYILRDNLPDNEPWTYERHHPDLKKKISGIGHLGDIQFLEDLVEFKMGVYIRDEHQRLDFNEEEGVPLIEARNILHDGRITYENTRLKVKVSEEQQLKKGDICISTILQKTGKIRFASISDEMLPLAASRNVLVLRPKEDTSSENLLLLEKYFNSEVARRWIYANNPSIQISIASIRNMPVPVPDHALKVALKSLKETIKIYESWIKEAEKATSDIFEFDRAEDARIHILSTGQIVRQRIKAASLIDDFNYRVRNRYPFPVAYRWRTVESAKPDLEGYKHVLECFENTLAYLALVSLSIVSNMEDRKIGYLESIQKKLTRKGHGISLGDWLAVINELNEARDFRYLPERTPFYEIFNFLKVNPELKNKAYALKGYRNNFAHGKGPKGKVAKDFNQARKELKDFLEGIEFVSEYPLRLIEETNVDSIEGITHYKSRDLMGDHSLVPVSEFTSHNLELESGSLYLVDRGGSLHLLRPWMLRRECPTCGRSTVYYLDSFDKKSGDCILRGMDHQTTTKDSELDRLFRYVGLLE